MILLIPSELLKTNPNNIAIELHRLNAEETKPQVYTMAVTLPKDSIISYNIIYIIIFLIRK